MHLRYPIRRVKRFIVWHLFRALHEPLCLTQEHPAQPCKCNRYPIREWADDEI
jgi:hypothetical protein